MKKRKKIDYSMADALQQLNHLWLGTEDRTALFWRIITAKKRSSRISAVLDAEDLSRINARNLAALKDNHIEPPVTTTSRHTDAEYDAAADFVVALLGDASIGLIAVMMDGLNDHIRCGDEGVLSAPQYLVDTQRLSLPLAEYIVMVYVEKLLDAADKALPPWVTQ